MMRMKMTMAAAQQTVPLDFAARVAAAAYDASFYLFFFVFLIAFFRQPSPL